MGDADAEDGRGRPPRVLPLPTKRTERLGRALRDNLRKRKAQAYERSGQRPGSAAVAAEPERRERADGPNDDESPGVD